MEDAGTDTNIHLSEEQVRHFIADGYIVLQPDLPQDLNESIFRRLDKSIPNKKENPGNNILPLVPELRHVLSCPEVQSALQTLLGPGYLEHPHRFCHVEEPSENAVENRTLKISSNCHQDSYTPLGRPRLHHIRYARVMYYPQDTPESIGPTHVIPGTHLNTTLSDTDRARPLPVSGPAGTVCITHFDVGHAAGLNQTRQRRFMVKFIYQRASSPVTGKWSGPEHRWQDPDTYGGIRLSLAWSHLWDWLRGARHLYSSLRDGSLPHVDSAPSVGTLTTGLEKNQTLVSRVTAAEMLAALGSDAAPAIPDLVKILNRLPDPVRVAAIYALGSIGTAAVSPLINSLHGHGNADSVRSVRRDHYIHHGLGENALQLDDASYALSAIGKEAIPSLLDLLESGDEWARMNAAFALGEMDQQALAAVPALIQALEDPSHLIVRTAADALGTIGSPQAAKPLGALFQETRPEWEEEIARTWSPRDQIRVNAATALARLGPLAAAAEPELIEALDDQCGQVATYAVETLRRIGSPSALDAAFNHLNVERWDPSITSNNGF